MKKINIMENTNETPKTISFRMVEHFRTMVVREPIEINVEDYPELNGMTEEEMQDYISENWYDMNPTGKVDYVESLLEECLEADIIREKIYDDEKECRFE